MSKIFSGAWPFLLIFLMSMPSLGSPLCSAIFNPKAEGIGHGNFAYAEQITDGRLPHTLFESLFQAQKSKWTPLETPFRIKTQAGEFSATMILGRGTKGVALLDPAHQVIIKLSPKSEETDATTEYEILATEFLYSLGEKIVPAIFANTLIEAAKIPSEILHSSGESLVHVIIKTYVPGISLNDVADHFVKLDKERGLDVGKSTWWKSSLYVSALSTKARIKEHFQSREFQQWLRVNHPEALQHNLPWVFTGDVEAYNQYYSPTLGWYFIEP